MPTLSSAADVKYELDRLRPIIHLEETEETWDKIAKAFQELIKLCENGAYDLAPTELVSTIRTSHRPIISAMNSERTRLCVVPMDLLSTLASVMGTDFEQFLPLFMPTLLALCARTNKVIVNRAKASILAIIESTQLASVLTYFLQNIKDKSSTLKVVIAECTLACLNSCNPPDFEKEARAIEVESIIRISARDANADVRKLSRQIFESYKILLPSRVPSFVTPLSPTTKKYLDIKAPAIATQKSAPNLRAATNPNPKKPEPKPSSSSTTLGARSTHSRTASSSTISTSRSTSNSQAVTSLTRVSRKEPVAPRSNAASGKSAGSVAAAPHVPVRPTQPTRVMTTDGSSHQRTISMTAAQRPTTTVGPLRSQPSIVSRSTTTTGAPSASSGAQRIQKDSSTSASKIQQRQQPQGLPSVSITTGPRRIPMPPPPSPPPSKKDAETSRRPASRAGKDKDTASANPLSSSTTTASARPVAAPFAPIKKQIVSSLSSSLRGKASTTTATERVGIHARSRSTVVTSGSTTATTAAEKTKNGSNTTASTSRSTGVGASAATTGTTRPLAVSKAATKPLWGSRPVPPAKSTSSTAAAAAGSAATKGLVKKPSSRTVSGPSSSTAVAKGVASKRGTAPMAGTVTNPDTIKRPVTPAQIALPPSPTPEKEETGEEVEQQQDENRLPCKEEVIVEEPMAAKAPSEGSSTVLPIQPLASVEADNQIQEEESADQEIVNEDPAEANVAEVIVAVISRSASPTAESLHVIAAAAIPEVLENALDVNENVSGESDETEVETPLSRQPLVTVPCDPQTPLPTSSSLPLAPNLVTPSLIAKTPITALLSSIERGFQYDYSPITPLSPASNYLPNLTGEGTPYSHATHAPHRRFPLNEGPAQPFNHALHVVGHNGMFEGFVGGNGDGVEKNVKRQVAAGAELSVVPVPVQLGTEKMYAMPIGLPGLDDGRMAFVELNNTSRS